MKKLRVGILGGTGMVGQRFITLLAHHPWFEVTTIAASERSKGKTYEQAVSEKWKMQEEIPADVKNIIVQSVTHNAHEIAQTVDFVFSALDMKKDEIKHIEETYAAFGVPVISNNSAHRWTDDIPMIIPEVNSHHIALIPMQKKKRGWKKGFIVVKPNCSIQSYVSILTALQQYIPEQVQVISMQAISGAGKNFSTWPEMIDNVIPFIPGEEEKSEKEPLKIWGKVVENKIIPASLPHISATCIRLPITDGHMAHVSVTFAKKPSIEEIKDAIYLFNKNHVLVALSLPSAPTPYITFFETEDRPQMKLDRVIGSGMGISMGKLREQRQFHYSFISLAHNTVRGAAGGAILTAELLHQKGYFFS